MANITPVNLLFEEKPMPKILLSYVKNLADEAMKCVLLYHVMFSPFFLLCFIVSEVFCKKHGEGTAWREQGGRVAVAFRLIFSQEKNIYLKRS